MISSQKRFEFPKIKERGCAVDLLNSSTAYRFLLEEKEEILRLKWLESEKAGRDIGFERALLTWIRYHKDDWRRARRNSFLKDRNPRPLGV